MTMHPRVPAGLVVGLTLSLTSPPAAYAETLSHRDPRHDVVTFDEEGGVIHRPNKPDPDVVRTRLAHLSDRVIIRLTFASLRRDRHDRTTYGRIETPHGLYRLKSIINARKATATLVLRTNGAEVSCAHLTQSIKYASDRLRLRVPRTCLDSPRWVQVGVLTSLDRPGTFGWWDDGLRKGVNQAGRPTLSPRLAKQ